MSTYWEYDVAKLGKTVNTWSVDTNLNSENLKFDDFLDHLQKINYYIQGNMSSHLSSLFCDE
jgi:hypothetical protein